MSYTENRWQGNEYRQEYLNGINNIVNVLRKNADETRINRRSDILNNVDFYRKKLGEMLGYPLNKSFDTDDIPNIKKTFVAKDGMISIYRVQIEVLKDLWFYGLYFEHDDNNKHPLVICQHGGMGTPEICSSLFDSSNYNNMTKRVLSYGVNAFAPQLLLWHSNTYGIDYDRREIDQSLKQVGSSITAIEVYAIMKSINYFCSLHQIDTSKIGMVGLSYGGFYTLFTTACDTRIKAALSSSFYNNRYEHNWSDWVWQNSAGEFLDSEVALLVYPRYLSIVVGNDDPLFKAESAKKEFDSMMELCNKNHEWIKFDIFEGVHEFPTQEDYLKNWMEKFMK
ncbi:MAG: dienelactone hydrolase family protein [Clostridia bacterium]|nr:dienelactone hydrolase family protein [Clostridia bacterium]